MKENPKHILDAIRIKLFRNDKFYANIYIDKLSIAIIEYITT